MEDEIFNNNSRLSKREEILYEMNFFKRNFFRKMNKGSLRGSIISWVRMTFGVGIFALPYCFSQFGILTATILLLFSALYSYWSFKDILIISDTCQKNDLYEIVRFYLGKKYSEFYKIFVLLILGSLFLIYPLITYQIFQKITLNYIDYNLDNNGNVLNYNSKNFLIRFVFLMSIYVISIPLLLKKRIDNMNYISFIFIIIIIYFVVLIIIQFPFFFKSVKKDYNNKIELISVSSLDYNFVTNFSTILASFFVQHSMLSIKRELKNPNKRRIFKVLKISLIIEVIFYFIIGIFGYLSVGNKAESLIILRNPLKNFNDIAIKIGLYIFIFINIIGVPVYNPAFKRLIVESYNLKNTKKVHLLTSLLPYLVGVIIGTVYPNIINIFGFLSAIICNVIAYFSIFLIKILIYIKNNKNKSKSGFIVSLFCLFFSIFLFLVYVSFFIVQIFN